MQIALLQSMSIEEVVNQAAQLPGAGRDLHDRLPLILTQRSVLQQINPVVHLMHELTHVVTDGGQHLLLRLIPLLRNPAINLRPFLFAHLLADLATGLHDFRERFGQLTGNHSHLIAAIRWQLPQNILELKLISVRIRIDPADHFSDLLQWLSDPQSHEHSQNEGPRSGHHGDDVDR